MPGFLRQALFQKRTQNLLREISAVSEHDLTIKVDLFRILANLVLVIEAYEVLRVTGSLHRPIQLKFCRKCDFVSYSPFDSISQLCGSHYVFSGEEIMFEFVVDPIY